MSEGVLKKLLCHAHFWLRETLAVITYNIYRTCSTLKQNKKLIIMTLVFKNLRHLYPALMASSELVDAACMENGRGWFRHARVAYIRAVKQNYQ